MQKPGKKYSRNNRLSLNEETYRTKLKTAEQEKMLSWWSISKAPASSDSQNEPVQQQTTPLTLHRIHPSIPVTAHLEETDVSNCIDALQLPDSPPPYDSDQVLTAEQRAQITEFIANVQSDLNPNSNNLSYSSSVDEWEVIKSAEWWASNHPIKPISDDSEEDYVFVNQSDYVESLSQLLSDLILQHTEQHYCRGKAIHPPSPNELQVIVNRVLNERSKKTSSALRSIYTAGEYAYVAYGWTSTVWALYRRPWIITLLTTGATKAVTTLIVLFL